jgi:hemerythrin superfamily protein
MVDSNDGARDGDLVTLLGHEHREIDDLLTLLRAVPPQDPQQRDDVVHRIMVLLVRHAVLEETFVYPAVRRYAPGGDVIAAQALAEHDEIQRTFEQLGGVEPHEARFDDLIEQAQRQLRDHTADEEERIFPMLRGHVPADALRDVRARAMAASNSPV